jgi:hypothetical protein
MQNIIEGQIAKYCYSNTLAMLMGIPTKFSSNQGKVTDRRK